MRVPVVLVFAAGCGRIDFEARQDAVDAPREPTTYLISTSSTGTEPTSLLTLDIPTGQIVELSMFSGFGVLGGLAYWDANTLYATSNSPGVVVEITLSPFAASQIQTFTGGISALERASDRLIGIDDASDELVSFMPGGTMTRLPLRDPASAPITANGGDLVEMLDGTWLYFTNSTQQLYTLDLGTAIATPVGSPAPTTPYISGMVRDDADRLFLTSGSSDAVIEIDSATGQLGTATPVCLLCPVTYDLRSGDATRSK